MIKIITADITKLEVDAIVNAANCSLFPDSQWPLPMKKGLPCSRYTIP